MILVSLFLRNMICLKIGKERFFFGFNKFFYEEGYFLVEYLGCFIFFLFICEREVEYCGIYEIWFELY